MLFLKSDVIAAASERAQGRASRTVSSGLEQAVERIMLLDWAEAAPFESRVSAMTFDIFLSHAYADKIIVFGLYQLLTQLKFSVYVDWIYDQALNRGTVTPATAEILRIRMRQCKSLFYVTTDSHPTSKWMPWECGYFDGFDGKPGSFNTPQYAKHQGHVAILPVVDDQQNTFTGQEYLGLYCYASQGSGAFRDVRINAPSSISLNSAHPVKFDPWIQGTWPT